MNYEAYFNNAKQSQIGFATAHNMLICLLNVMSTHELNCLWEECEKYKY